MMMKTTKAIKDSMDPKAGALKRGTSQTRATLAEEVVQQAIELPNGMWERISRDTNDAFWLLPGLVDFFHHDRPFVACDRHLVGE